MTNTPVPLISESDWADATWELGAHPIPGTDMTTFAVYATKATRVILELFDAPIGAEACTIIDMVRGKDGVWRAQADNCGHGDYYGFRVWGPNWEWDEAWTRGGSDAGFKADFDEDGNRFNPNKLLFDPYAREISHTPNSPLIAESDFDSGMFGTGADDYFGAPRRNFDTGKWAPKGIIIADSTRTGRRPNHSPEDRIIYEAHVKGLTRHPSSTRLEDIFADIPSLADMDDVPDEYRGTYRGAGYLAPYLKSLGFNTIELLPVHETSKSDMTEGTFNYWGYETLAYFAPIKSYAYDQSPGGPTHEFKQMVKAFHREGIEVYLDVVYNHSGEGGHWNGDLNTTGFTSLGGFATADYYSMTHEKRLVDGATGVSNTLNFSTEVSQRLVLDSLAYWYDKMGVDGFRFDLAPVLGRKPFDADAEDWNLQRRFFPDHPLMLAIRDWAGEVGAEVVAEAWDLWGYEVGNFPQGWSEWNGRFRDAVRCFMKGDANTYDFIARMNGDYDHFASHGGAFTSVNFITAHDGFTMADLVSYNTKDNNQPWPFGPSDGGSDDNDSWDSGGDQALRRQRLRNFWTVLMVSRGVPMVVAGDEYGRTQNGNNNPYSIDSAGVWQNWEQAASRAPHRELVDESNSDWSYHDNFGMADSAPGVNPIWRLAHYVTNLRREHQALRQRDYGDAVRGNGDVSYIFGRPDGHTASDTERALRLLIDTGDRRDCLLVLINMAASQVDYAIPRANRDHEWVRIVDTAAYAEPDGNCWHMDEAQVVSNSYTAQAWSVVVLRERHTGRIRHFDTRRTIDQLRKVGAKLRARAANVVERLRRYPR